MSGEKCLACDQCGARFESEDILYQHLVDHVREESVLAEIGLSNSEGVVELYVTDDGTILEKKEIQSLETPASDEHTASLSSDQSVFSNSQTLVSMAQSSAEIESADENQTDETIPKPLFERHLPTFSPPPSKKPFACEQCPRKFSRLSEAKQHVTTSHSANSEQDKTTGDLNLREEKQFVCKRCQAQFASKSELQVHRVKHNNEKRHACPHCPARYKRPSALSHHLLSHNNMPYVVSFSCMQCPQLFKTESGIKRHLERNPGHSVVTYSDKDEKIYPCKLCTEEYTSEYYLYRHILSAHVG